MDGKGNSKNMEYKSLLVKLARNCTDNNFKELKVMCGIKKAKAEKMEYPTELFDYLEELDKIKAGDVNHLIEMYEHLEKFADAKLMKEYQLKYGDEAPENNDISSKGSNDVTLKAVTQAEADDVDASFDSDLNAAFEFLKDNIGRKWRELARTQGLTQVDIHAIEESYPRDLKEQSYQALLLWQKKQKRDANIDSLEQSLRKRHLNQMANDIKTKKYLS